MTCAHVAFTKILDLLVSDLTMNHLMQDYLDIFCLNTYYTGPICYYTEVCSHLSIKMELLQFSELLNNSIVEIQVIQTY